jgi:hypothetical protein
MMAMAKIHVTAVTATEIDARFGGCEDGIDCDGWGTLRPGDELFGRSCADLVRHGVGPVEIEDGA